MKTQLKIRFRRSQTPLMVTMKAINQAVTRPRICIAKSNKPLDCDPKAKTAYRVCYLLQLDDNILDFQRIHDTLHGTNLFFLKNKQLGYLVKSNYINFFVRNYYD